MPLPPRRATLLCLLTLLFLAPLVGAQTGNSAAANTDDETTAKSRFPLWSAKLPGGEIMIALGAIQFVSSHEYLVDGLTRVVEVNVAISGDMVTRFYYVSPQLPQTPNGIGQTAIAHVLDKAEQVAARTGQDEPWKRVIKNYPTSTHAHTVEYRLDSEEQLDSLFKSVSQAWKRNRSDNFKLEE